MSDELDYLDNQISYWKFFKKSVCWTSGHAFFGLLPLLFMLFVEFVSDEKVGTVEVSHLLKDGVHLFVCCAVIGAIVVELFLSGYKMKISRILLLLVIPIFIFGLILVDYLLIQAKAISEESFSINFWTSKIVITFTALYCIFMKAFIYIKEEEEKQKALTHEQ